MGGYGVSFTMKDIAEKAGVSVATVSRVINKSGYVSEKNKEKIEEIIRELNYCPNAAARILTTQASDMIGLVMPERVNPFFVKVYDGVTRKADEENITVLFYKTSDDEMRQQEILNQLKAQNVKGILITPSLYQTSATRKMVEAVEEAGIPVVLIDRDIEGSDFDAVFIDNKGAIYKATEQLIQTGHTQIAAVTSPDFSRTGSRRQDGFQECMKKYGLKVRPEWVIEGKLDVESGYEACRRMMEMEHSPTAIVAFSSSELIGCVKYLNETGYRIGSDVCLFGFDDIGTFPDFGLPLSTIERPMREMGEVAFELLWERIQSGGRKKRSREIVLPTNIHLHHYKEEIKHET